jgi:hypothetical protein
MASPNLKYLESMENLELPPEVVQARIQAHSQPLTSPTTLFPMPVNQRLRNSRVPKSTLNATRGFVSNGFVRPQNARNSTFNTRRRIFEDNFIKRMIKMVEDSMLKDTPINLQVYADRLLAPDCSREEAILLYDELIAIFIILILYIVYVIKDTMEKLQVNPSLNPSKMIISSDKAKIFSKISQTLARTLYPIGLTSVPGLFWLFASILTIGAAGAGIPLIALGSITGLILVLGSIKILIHNKMSEHESILEKEKTNLLFVIQTLFNIIRDNRNTIKINSVKDEIKYWGLTKAQVDYLFVPDNNHPRTTLTDTTEYPQIQSAEELGINENVHEQLVIAREASILLQRRTNNEEYAMRGYIVVDVELIKEFILKAGENKEILAPNELFTNSLVKFGKRNATITGASAGKKGGKRNKQKTHRRRK